MSLRIRQLVIAASSLDSARTLQSVLGLGTPYADPGVGEFGLTNAVFALGDQFIEFIIPITPDAPARRFIERNGVGGYMAIFQLPDVKKARAHLDAIGMRRVWNSDHDDILASHIHPADIGGAIVSIDQPAPPSEWRWGGPDWKAESVAGALTGAKLTSPDPEKLAARWRDALGQSETGKPVLETDDGPVIFSNGADNALTEFHIAMPDPEAILARARISGLATTDAAFALAGTRFSLKRL